MFSETVFDSAVSPVGPKSCGKIGAEIRPVNLAFSDGHVSHIKADVGESELNQVKSSHSHTIANNVDEKLSVSTHPQVLNVPMSILSTECEISGRSRREGAKVNVATPISHASEFDCHVGNVDVESKGQGDDDDANVNRILSVPGKHATHMIAALRDVEQRVKGEVECIGLKWLWVFLGFLLLGAGVTVGINVLQRRGDGRTQNGEQEKCYFPHDD